MKTLNTFADARNAMVNAGNSMYAAQETSEGGMATLACSIVAMVAQGNGESVTFTIGEGEAAKDVNVTPDVLIAYAEKTLPKKAEDASADYPTANMLLDAITAQCDAVADAKAERLDIMTRVKDNKRLAPATLEKMQAKVAKIDRALNAIKKPFRDGLTLAAAAFYAVNEDGKPYYDVTTASTEAGSFFVSPIKRDADDVHPERITAKAALDMFKKERAPQTNTGKKDDKVKVARDHTAVSDHSVTLTDEAVKRGGDQRQSLAMAINAFTDILSNLDGAPTAQERKALQNLWRQAGDMLDDDAILEASEQTA